MKSPRGLTREVRSVWMSLTSPHEAPRIFDPEDVNHLPEPVRRWLRHAIYPGTGLASSAEVRMHGQIRLGTWRTFAAVQSMTPTGGFVWAATARTFGLPVIGFDRYTRGSGQMRWRLLDVLPVMHAEGPDITRSAAGRHAGELLLYLPAAALSEMITWREVDHSRAAAVLRVGPTHAKVMITVGPTGALTELAFPRWGIPDGEPFAEYPFGAAFENEVTFNGVTLPRDVIAGWHFGTARWPEGQFIRYTIDKLL